MGTENDYLNSCLLKAEQGHSDAQYNLGYMYYNGEGVVQDYKEAVKWYRKAAEQGDADAQYNLGGMYKNGQGVVQNYKEAVKWTRKSAEQGDSYAQYNLGNMYYKGKGVPKDYVMAHMYWNLASVDGNKNAIENRDLIAKEMTPSQIEESQKLAREWMTKKREREKKAFYDFFKDVDTSSLDESEETKTENSSPEKEILTNKSQTNNSSSNQKITVKVIDDKTHSKNNETAIVKGTVKTFLPYLFGYLFFFFITKQRNPFSKPVDVEQRPKWLFSLIVGMSFGVYGTSGVGIDSGDFLGYLVIKSAFFFIGVIFATFVFFIYRWKVRRNLS